MKKISEEVARQVVVKFMGGEEDWIIERIDDWNDEFYFFANLKKQGDEIMYVGSPIYILVDDKAKARFATPEETFKITRNNDNE